MSKILVHLVTGPENPTRAALALLVARTAAGMGHTVTLFLAGDAVAFLRDATLDVAHGIGTGSMREHWDALAEAGVPVYASGMSSKARAVDGASIAGRTVEFAPPERLVELMSEADTLATY